MLKKLTKLHTRRSCASGDAGTFREIRIWINFQYIQLSLCIESHINAGIVTSTHDLCRLHCDLFRQSSRLFRKIGRAVGDGRMISRMLRIPLRLIAYYLIERIRHVVKVYLRDRKYTLLFPIADDSYVQLSAFDKLLDERRHLKIINDKLYSCFERLEIRDNTCILNAA